MNVARALAPLDSKQMADFVANLVPINALAEASPGSVWRLQTEAGDATALWWIRAGTVPSLADAEERLLTIRAHGPSPRAFTLKEPVGAPANV